MNESKQLHIFNNETKFSKSYFNFLQDNNFDLSKHELFHYGNIDSSYNIFPMQVVFAKYYSVIKHLKLLQAMFKAEKIVIHSLASPWLLLFLYTFPKLIDKTYWVIWGKDLYFYQLLKTKKIHHKLYEFFRKRVFKKIKHVITYVKGDFELANKWYGTEAKYHECLMYPSNLYKNHQKKINKPNNTLTIQVGNSSDPSNNHDEIFQKLLPLKDKNIKIVAPLSYGNRPYAKNVIKLGKLYFGNKFTPITSFVPLDQYILSLNQIDVAIFAHNRQQAMGNIITLLGMGKCVFLKGDTSSYQLFNHIGIEIYDFNEMTMNNIFNEVNESNTKKVAQYFSAKNLKKQWQCIFNEK